MGDVLAIVRRARQADWRGGRRKRSRLTMSPRSDHRSARGAQSGGAKNSSPRKSRLLQIGDPSRGRAGGADPSLAHVVSVRFTQRIEHMFLEPEACIAIPMSVPTARPA